MSRASVWASALAPSRCTNTWIVESSTGQPTLAESLAAAAYEPVTVAKYASLSSKPGLSCWWALNPQRSRIGQPQPPSTGSFPCHTLNATRPNAVRICIAFRRRWCALRPFRGENPAVAVRFALKPFLQSAAHPFPTFHFHFHFQFPQRAGCFCFRVHRYPFVRGFIVARNEEPLTSLLWW